MAIRGTKVGIRDKPLCAIDRRTKIIPFFFPPPSHRTNDTCHIKTSSLRISGRASLYEVGNFENGDSQLYNFLHSCVIKIT